METVDTEWAEEQLAAAEAEIEQQKKEWEMERIAIEQADARSKRLDEEFEDDDVPLTYSSVDAKNQVNEISINKISKKEKKKTKRLDLMHRPKSVGGVQSETEQKKKKIKSELKNKKYLRRRQVGSADEPQARSSFSSSAPKSYNSEIKSKLKVEAIRLEHLPLLSNVPDSNLIAKSLARMKRKS